MEFIEGVTLREKIHYDKPSLPKLLKYLTQVAEGLSKAHAAGIVHRDLKPDNIMITRDGYAKILDFGLAKLIEVTPMQTEGSSEVLTAPMPAHSTPGVIMGTVGYMSPEQAQARVVDHRSDIFSFGCVLYEATTGRAPFVGDSSFEILHKIISESAPAISIYNPQAPAELQRIVRKCLAKEREKRYQNIGETTSDLAELLEVLKVSEVQHSVAPSVAHSTKSITEPSRSAVSGISRNKFGAGLGLLAMVAILTGIALYTRGRNSDVTINSIAVMPFVNGSSNADVEYLSDGMTETLISSLSQLPNLTVRPRSAVFRYKGKENDPQAAGTELNVQAVLNGRVEQRAEELSLFVELVDVALNKVVWSQHYRRKQADLVSLQSEIARDVSGKLRAKLSGSDEAKVTKNYTANPEAYQLYLKGRFYWNKRSIESLKQAVDFYNQAIEKDPGYALAFSGLAETYVLYAVYTIASPRDSMPQAKAAALRALELDNSVAEAHTALGYYFMHFEFDATSAEREFRRAIELNPNYASAYQWLAFDVFMITKRFDEAVSVGKRAEEFDPLSKVVIADVGNILYFSKRYDESIAQVKRALMLDSDFGYARYILGNNYMMKGQHAEAIAEYRKSLAANYDPYVKALIVRALAKSGQRVAAVKLLDELTSESSKRYIPNYSFAVAHTALGEKAQALLWLEKDVAERSAFAIFASVDPALDDLRNDHRFKALLKQMNLPE
jgi:serine/threonine-protein kinase